MGSTVLKHEVYLNGQKLDFVSSFNWETPPQHSFQDIKDIGTVHDRRIQVTTYMKGAGSATVLAPVGMPSNDPMSLMDILGFRFWVVMKSMIKQLCKKNRGDYTPGKDTP